MFAKINSLGLFGLNAFAVDVEIETSKGTPAFDIVGLPDTVVKESRERIRSALRENGIAFPLAKVIVNLAPYLFRFCALREILPRTFQSLRLSEKYH